MCLLTAGQLHGMLDENPHMRENCYSFMRDIRATQAYCGTQAYWISVKIQSSNVFHHFEC